MKKLRMRIFIGGTKGHSRDFFNQALAQIKTIYGNNLYLEFLNTDQMKRFPFKFNPKELIDWLLDSDIHIIVGHLHQGNNHLQWDMEELMNEYKRLRQHIGYPAGAEDPVFLQEKFASLDALPEEDHVPTFKLKMPEVSDENEIAISKNDLKALIM